MESFRTLRGTAFAWRPQKLSLIVRKLHRKLRPVHGVVVPVNQGDQPARDIGQHGRADAGFQPCQRHFLIARPHIRHGNLNSSRISSPAWAR